jgi:hypothetical protein
MPRAGINPHLSVERFFQLSVLGLVTSGYLAVAGSGYFDIPTIALTGFGLFLRAMLVTGILQFKISETARNPPDPGIHRFLSARLLLSFARLPGIDRPPRLLSRRDESADRTHHRDYLYRSHCLPGILAAAILSANLSFLAFLGLYLLCAVAAFTSAEIRRAMQKPHQIARAGLRRFHLRLGGLAAFVTCGILLLTAGLFFVLPRSANATLSRLVSRRMHLPGFSNEVTLDQIGQIMRDSRAVMHIRPDPSSDFPNNLKWRGVALSGFDGKRWSNPSQRGRPIPLSEGWGTRNQPPASRAAVCFIR